MRPLVAALLALAVAPSPARAQQPADSALHVRVNQVGYLTDAPKVAVVCAVAPLPAARLASFTVRDVAGRIVLGPAPARHAGAFGPCRSTWRLDFSAVRRPGRYVIHAGESRSPVVRVGDDVWAGAADTMLHYMRQQRSGWNPFFRDSVHRLDGRVVDDTGRVVKFVPVSGGWADAADYLQYVTTSAVATHALLAAHRDHPAAFADRFDARGLPGANGVSDALDEARHGLDWLLRMYPGGDEMYNQLGDDRDHSFIDLPTTDSSDYGWGKGGYRPVYPCTGRPQGLFAHRNRSSGYASTAGKYAAVFALAAQLHRGDSAFARTLRERALAAYDLGRRHPGSCQTAPARAPYFYEEDDWADDMELAAAQLHALTGEHRFLREALEFARVQPVKPWMGADTARHYQWFPWYDAAHHELWRTGSAAERRLAAGWYREGLERVARRAGNGFRMGVPFIWCSNNLVASLATQALLYRRMTGDARFRPMEQAMVDWLFGANPWGVSMVIGYPAAGVTARDPHSVVAQQLGVASQLGGLLDGPVYASIFRSLKYVRLVAPDEYAAFNGDSVVYHDDFGDYSTNEPIMDGTATMARLMAALASPPPRLQRPPRGGRAPAAPTARSPRP